MEDLKDSFKKNAVAQTKNFFNPLGAMRDLRNNSLSTQKRVTPTPVDPTSI